MAAAAIGAGAAVVGVGSSIFGGVKANERAQIAAERQAELKSAQRAEEIRRLQRAVNQRAAAGKASAYASGVQIGGTTERYMSALDVEGAREVSFARKAAHLERRAIEAGAAGAGDALIASGVSRAVQAAGSMMADYYGSRQATQDTYISDVYGADTVGRTSSYESTPSSTPQMLA
jgi:hypothetical protein